MKIGNRILNDKSKCFIIAELSANHNGIDIALEMFALQNVLKQIV